jgi:hypothetical protein
MLRFRTKLLLLSLIIFGVGIGVLSPFAEGAYSAICLFFLPLVVALSGASIIADFSRPVVLTRRVVTSSSKASPEQHLPHAA